MVCVKAYLCMKISRPNAVIAKQYIEHYKQSLRNLAAQVIHIVTHGAPVLTGIMYRSTFTCADGSKALRFGKAAIWLL